MSTIIIDYRADEEIIFNLGKLGYTVIPSFNNNNVSVHLSGHPDMQICKCSDNVFVSSPECYEYYNEVLKNFNICLIKGKTPLESHYPKDVAYNVAWIGEMAIHNFKFTDTLIKEYFENNSIQMINVSQGYSKCNICNISDNAIITSDKGIYDKLTSCGADVLLITEKYIDIFGWNYGFIGGASGKISSDTIAFLGDIEQHPDFERIIKFLNKHNMNYISLSNKRLMDLGSLILIDKQYNRT